MPFEVELLPPAVEFLRTVEVKLRAKAARSIELLREFGPVLSMPHARQLSGYPMSELRVKQGTDILRLFYFRRDSVTYTVTSGYLKKTDKTSRREIERALRLRATVLEAEDEGG